MKKVFALLLAALCFQSCRFFDLIATVTEPKENENIRLSAHSRTPNFLKLSEDFQDVFIYPLLSSEDTLRDSPLFIYGSSADGAGLLKDENGFTLINNMEGDYSIARVIFDKTLKPIFGEYIVNAIATANTAQCSGSLITPEEHGFGPYYLSGGEAGGSSTGVFITDPYKLAKDASVARILTALGQWYTENAVVIGQNAYPSKTVVFIGDDDKSNGQVPSGNLGMYVGDRGDLDNGKLYSLKVLAPNIQYEMDMREGVSYDMQFKELSERTLALLNAEALDKRIMGFARVEDLDWRRGSAKNEREIYFCVTGLKSNAYAGKGSAYGRVYKVELNEKDPTFPGKITCVLDGDLLEGKAKSFHSPDNILLTKNYAYIQEDPNGYFDSPDKNHNARLYQYNLNTGELKVVLECDEKTGVALGYGRPNMKWELSGMIDISSVIGKKETYLLISQNHGWSKKDGWFTDPKANADPGAVNEGSVLHLIQGLPN